MTAHADFSEDLDRLWNFGDPAQSEIRFREMLGKHAPGSREALETTTQIARTHSLRRNFTAADATLDPVEKALAAAPARVTVRYLLERGRTRNSSGDKPAAVALFMRALDATARDTLPGADYYKVDALHMLGIATPPAEQIGWTRRAIDAAEASNEKRTRDWAASLHNNIGWSYFETGDAATALVHWRKALVAREAMGKAGSIRIAQWTVARGLRATGKLEEAQRMQEALVVETEKIGEPDGYVYEELAELALLRTEPETAAPWARKAWDLLKDDGYLKASEAARLSRLHDIAEGKAP